MHSNRKKNEERNIKNTKYDLDKIDTFYDLQSCRIRQQLLNK